MNGNNSAGGWHQPLFVERWHFILVFKYFGIIASPQDFKNYQLKGAIWISFWHLLSEKYCIIFMAKVLSGSFRLPIWLLWLARPMRIRQFPGNSVSRILPRSTALCQYSTWTFSQWHWSLWQHFVTGVWPFATINSGKTG